jgi:dienelactone hydrolase
MFKRARWMVVGYSLGAGTSYLAARRLRRVAQRYTPAGVADRVGGTKRNVQNAMSAGRDTMRDREGELRANHHIDRGARRRIRAT